MDISKISIKIVGILIRITENQKYVNKVVYIWQWLDEAINHTVITQKSQ